MKTRVASILAILLICGVAHAVQVGGAGVNGPEFPSYTRHHDMQIGAAVLGPDAPDLITLGTFRCASMATAAKTITFNSWP